MYLSSVPICYLARFKELRRGVVQVFVHYWMTDISSLSPPLCRNVTTAISQSEEKWDSEMALLMMSQNKEAILERAGLKTLSERWLIPVVLLMPVYEKIGKSIKGSFSRGWDWSRDIVEDLEVLEFLNVYILSNLAKVEI